MLKQCIKVFICYLMTVHSLSIASTTELLTHQIKPFSYVEHERFKGFAVDVVNAIQKELGISLPMKLYPFKRALKRVQSKDNIALFITARRPEREKTVKWVGPLVTSNVYFYKNRLTNIQINTLSDAKKANRIAVGSGNADHVYLKTLGFNNLSPTNSQKQSLQMLNLNRVALTPVSEIVMAETVKAAGMKLHRFERTNVKLYDSSLYLAFSLNTSDKEIEKWQTTLDILKNTGKYQLIYDRYIPSN